MTEDTYYRDRALAEARLAAAATDPKARAAHDALHRAYLERAARRQH